jgi:hypothetical protein
MKAICRVAKVKGAGSIGGKSDHNYRQGHVPNADPERKHLNQEYVLNYESLAKAIDARIEHAGIQRVRQDAVKGMEFVLTASPEAFKRDEAGQVVGDCRKSKWLQENLKFMKERYGSNLVAFTLHQDEKTPHIHAIVVPITPDGRLSAKELFNPKTLRQLQTDYAQAMKPLGLERGIEGSRARHVEMKHIYGLQQQERQTIEQQLQPLQTPFEPLTIDKPGTLDLLNLDRWKREQEAKINAEVSRRIAEIKKIAEKAQKAAVANATTKEQEKILRQKLATSEGLKQANHERAEKNSQQLKISVSTLEKVAVLLDERRLNPEWIRTTAQQVRSRTLPQIEKDVLESFQKSKALTTDKTLENFTKDIKKKGYELHLKGEDDPMYLEHTKTGSRIDLLSAKFKGKDLWETLDQVVEQAQKEQQKRQQNRGRGMRM